MGRLAKYSVPYLLAVVLGAAMAFCQRTFGWSDPFVFISGLVVVAFALVPFGIWWMLKIASTPQEESKHGE